MSATSFREKAVKSITTGVSSLPRAVFASESCLAQPAGT